MDGMMKGEAAVESKVPVQQTIRTDATKSNNANSSSRKEIENTLNQDDAAVATNDDFTLSPVITATRKEATFTKGDLKLQKITVTDEISIVTPANEGMDGSVRDVNTDCGGRFADVGPAADTNIVNEEENSKKLFRTPKVSSKIPKLKSVVNKLEGNTDANEKSLTIAGNAHQTSAVNVQQDNVLSLDRVSGTDIESFQNIAMKNESPVTDEEFEKIFEEIVENDIDSISNIKYNIHDPKKLETKFEEIIHAYDANKITSTDVKKIPSKIPLLKSKSTQDFEISKINNDEIPRKYSLGRVPVMNFTADKTTNVISKESYDLDNSNNLLLASPKSAPVLLNKEDIPPPLSNVESPTTALSKIPISQKINSRISSIALNRKPKSGNLNKNRLLKEYSTGSNKDIIDLMSNENNVIGDDIEDNCGNKILNMRTLQNKPNLKSDESVKDKSATPEETQSKQTAEPLRETADQNDHPLIKQEIINVTDTKKCDGKIIIDAPLCDIEIESKDTKGHIEKRDIDNTKDAEHLSLNNLISTLYISNLDDAEPSNTESKLATNTDDFKNHINNTDHIVDTNIDGSPNKIVKYKYIKPSNVVDKRNEEDIIILKGKVNRVINRLDCIESRVTKTVPDDLPKEPAKTLRAQSARPNTMPRVIDSLLKENIEGEAISKDEQKNSKDLIGSKDVELRNEDILQVNSENKISNVENNQMCVRKKCDNLNTPSHLNDLNNNTTERISTGSGEIEVEELKSFANTENNNCRTSDEHDVFVKKCDDIINEYKMKQEQKIKNISVELKKGKSLVELNLIEAVADNGRKIKTRTKSVDKMEFRRDVIDSREKPKRGAVSKNIALFESRLASTRVPARNPTQRMVTFIPSQYQLFNRVIELAAAAAKNAHMENMAFVNLSGGHKMPSIAVGTALLESSQTREVVRTAIELGYRAFDTAYIYGTERQVGEAIRDKIQDGTVTRDELFIASKLWSTFHRSDLVEKACRASLETLGLDYFDLFMIHNPMSFKEGSEPVPIVDDAVQYSEHDYMDAWYGIEGLVEKGLVKLAGVSNFNSEQLMQVLEKGKLKPVVNQVESHPYLNQLSLSSFCEVHNVKLNVFGTLGSKGTPSELKGATLSIMDDPLVKLMAAGLEITPAQLLISYQLHLGRSVVVKSSSKERLQDNLRALTVQLLPQHVTALSSLNTNQRTFTFKGMGDTHKHYPFNIEF